MAKRALGVHLSGQKDNILYFQVKNILYTIFFLMLISGIIIYYILTGFDPDLSPKNVFYLLYITTVLFVTGFLSITIYWLKVRIIKKNIIKQYLTSSVRQAFLISATLIILLILYTFGVLSYWDAIPIILAFFFLELFFQSEKISNI